MSRILVFMLFAAVSLALAPAAFAQQQAEPQNSRSNLRIWDSPHKPTAPAPEAPHTSNPFSSPYSQKGGGYRSGGSLDGQQAWAEPMRMPEEQAPANAPVDGGLALLAAAGAGYAVRKLRKRGGGDGEDSATP